MICQMRHTVKRSVRLDQTHALRLALVLVYDPFTDAANTIQNLSGVRPRLPHLMVRFMVASLHLSTFVERALFSA